ncbi:MAG TPA: hypothetical protein VEZ55_01545 [Chitinophagaceae bacterium]|jgi:hypothetical protein|nr:hypothetical protein [Chitinophagaceae bacterium]
MQAVLSAPLSRLKQISTHLVVLDGSQSSFILIETLFLEALYILRSNDEELHNTELLTNLLKIKENEYKASLSYHKSLKSKEKAIRLFKHYFKKALDQGMLKPVA